VIELDSVSSAPAVAPARIAPFAALRYRDYRLMWFGEFISQAGTQMQSVTINWHVYILTGSAVALGLTGLMRVIPIIAFSLTGGMFADTHDRKRLLLITQSAMMLFAAVLGLMTNLGWVSVVAIYLLAALTAAASAFDTPARKSLPPNLVPKEHLTNALSLHNVMHQAASIIGPAIAGFVIAGLGVAAVYWINALSFLAVLVALILIKTPTQEKLGAVRMNLSSFADGIRFVRRTEIIFSTMLLDFFATLFASASALLPIFARDILRVGPEGLGVLYAAGSFGAVLAGVGMSFIGNVRRKGLVMLCAIGVYGFATVLYGMSNQFVLSLFFLMLIGAGDTVSTILRNTIRQIATPDHLRGRMSGVMQIFVQGGPQLGNLEAGIAAALLSAPLSVITGGVATVLMVALVMWRLPKVREYGGEI
jgi:MFS family permease